MTLSRSWIALAESIGSYLAEQADDTVTFLLGAGASRSSGAPSTPEILEALTEKHPDEFPDSKVSAGMDAISDSQVESSIRPLFREIRPHIGYLSLAALAKSTRVLIVNLNWDPAVEIACDRLAVKCASVVLDEKKKLDEGLAKVEACLVDPQYRVVNLHLHGLLDAGDIRLAPKKTLAFQSKTTELLWSSFFTHPTVVVGATLTGERDVTGLITASSQGPEPKKNPFWLFSRQPDRTDIPEDRVAAELLSRNESELNFRGDPFVDFDRIMVEILAKRIKRPLNGVFAGTSLPQLGSEELILPGPDLLRGHLEKESAGRFLALVGERQIGKSTTAKLLAHWTALRSDGGIEVISAFGKPGCGHTAKRLREGSLTASPEDVVIFDDPFAVGEGESSETFVADLRAILASVDAPRVVVTASLSAWRKAVTETPELEQAAEIVVAKPTDWYRGPDLAALADDPMSEGPAMVTRWVLEGVASTPVRVVAANAGDYPSNEEQVIEDKLELLRGLGEDMQCFLALVRFYELSRTVIPQTYLAKHLEEETLAVPPCLQSLLRQSDLTEEPHQLFAHYTDRIAFDRLYLEQQKNLRSKVVEVAYGRNVVNEVCDMWLTIARLREGELERIAELARGDVQARRKLLEWGPLLLEEAANSRVSRPRLEAVLVHLLTIDGERDFWALRELVYEVVRLWPELHRSEVAGNFIKRTLADEDRMGCYCVLEAMLYFQSATHRQTWDRDYVLRRLWNRVTGALGDLIEDVESRGIELALIFDAVAWSRPPLGERELLSWVAPVLDALTKEESLKGAIALTCLYHPAGLELFDDLGRDSPLADIGNLTEGQIAMAAAMVRWHYVHQSRGRALLTRRRLEPACPELLRRDERDRLVPKTEAEAINKFVTRMAHFRAHRGWAVHLGFNLRCTSGKFDDRFLGRYIREMDWTDDGVVTAALTYRIPGGALAPIQEYFRLPTNRQRLIDAMLEGCRIESLSPSASASVEPPRFMAGRIPQQVHRELNTEWRDGLRNVANLNDADLPREIHAILSEAEVAGFVDAESKWLLLHHVQRGDLRPLETTRARLSRNRALKVWLKGRGELAEIVVSVACDMGDPTLI
ncbi:MAG: hypothetical protein WBV85_07375 [Solirubrobacteraceae bacterium]